jgi:hypothetical protein
VEGTPEAKAWSYHYCGVGDRHRSHVTCFVGTLVFVYGDKNDTSHASRALSRGQHTSGLLLTLFYFIFLQFLRSGAPAQSHALPSFRTGFELTSF